MLTRTQFQALFEKTVSDVKKIKANNDQLNKEIGISNDIQLYFKNEEEKNKIQSIVQNINEALGRLDKNYLDPDTARKMGQVRQQFKIQQDRRRQLLISIESVKNTQAFKRHLRNTAEPQKTSNQSKKTVSALQGIGQNYYRRMPTNQAGVTAAPHQEHIEEVDDTQHQMEKQLLKNRGQELKKAHAKLLDIQGIVQDSQKLVYTQGQRVDIISEDLFRAQENVQLANSQLKQAGQKQKDSKKKTMAFVIIILVILGFAGFFILIM